MPRLLAMPVLVVCVGGILAAGPPDAAMWERFGKIEEVCRLELRGDALYQVGKLGEATKAFAQVVKMYEGLYPKSLYPQGHQVLAASINNLGFLHQAQGEYAKAEPLYGRALEMTEGLYPKSLYPQGHPALANSINNLAVLHKAKGEYAKAETLYWRALEMNEGLYPKSRYPQGHPHLANSINNLAVLHKAKGEYAKAEPLYRRALNMREGLYPKRGYPQGHPDLATSINNLAVLHLAQGEYARAEPLLRRSLEMSEKLYPKTRYPQGHPELGRSINNLAGLHEAQGEYAKAEPLYRRALEMREGLYPKTRYPQGHPELGRSINNLAVLHIDQGDYAKAEPLYRRALKMREGLYPKARYPQGHPDLAQSINNLAVLHNDQGDYAKAEPLYRRALEMREGLYPKTRYPQGHPELGRSIHNLARLYEAKGEYVKAEPLYRRALNMREGLYPKRGYPQGHPDLATSINNLAVLHLAQGEYATAEPLLRRALEMYSDSAASIAEFGTEATALNYLASLPLARDAYLSVTTNRSKENPYAVVWQTKAALSRIAERRHLAVLAASSNEARELWEAIVSLKRERERLLLIPAGKAKVKARDEHLDEIDEGIRKKEAALLPLLPALKRSKELAKAAPADFQKVLPTDAVFVDLLRYTRFEQDPKVPGKKGEKRTPHYVAFVVTRSAIMRVELDKAKPIEEALDLWRRAIVKSSSSEAKYATELHCLIWLPLLKYLPAKTSTVFISPDAALNSLPWPALRDAKTGRILIENHGVATVPHGPMLLDRLTQKRGKPEAKPTLLAMGGVAYDKKPGTTEVALHGPVGDAIKWDTLTGTEKELRQLVPLAGERTVIRREGVSASLTALLADLPKAETAHLATHGYFADKKFRTVFQLDEKLFGRMGNERVGAGARSPMVLSGIVCAGANLPDTPNRGVLTADAIVGLDFRKMNLAVLSACETGLGDVAGGEGVFGLVRAFHIAGCRNVVASLWKVEDEATAALMVLFYRQLWGKEKIAPMEALRRAQVAIYREPERIKEWSRGRGPNPKRVVGGEKLPDKGPKAKTSPAKAWAAFVISGPGD